MSICNIDPSFTATLTTYFCELNLKQYKDLVRKH